ncbi:MAG: PPC domain-containing protein [Planctomycetaceae bacterium]|nr:PPC domain-containing protein [Planctomycetaceae bacterium]
MPSTHRPVRLSLIIASWALVSTCQPTAAQPPNVTTIRPLGVKPGETVDLRTTGGNLDGAQSCWTSFAGETPLATDIDKNGTDKGQTLYHVAVPADAPLGVHGLRVKTERGVSSLRLMLVDDLPTVAEAGGHQSPDKAQVVTLPAAIDGTIDNLSRDFYRFTVAAGQTVTFEVWSRRLGSPLDPVLILYAADGTELAYADDTPGLSSDAQAVHTFSEAGEYIIEVRDMQYRGSGNHFYRLRMGDFPALNTAVPASVVRGQETQVAFAGHDAAGTQPVSVLVPADSTTGTWSVAARKPEGTTHAFVSVAVSSGQEFTEQEPNNAAEQSNRVDIGTRVHGRIDEPGDIDRFVFTATEGTKVEFIGMTRELGTPTDLSLRVLKPDGGQLATVDDNGTSEGRVTATCAAAGDYTLEVRDLLHRGGPEFSYEVLITPQQPGFRLEAGSDTLNIPAGGVAAVAVSVVRVDYGGEIALSAIGLPAGVTATPAYIGPGTNATVMTFEASADCKVESFPAIQIVGTARIGEQEVQSQAEVQSALRGQWNMTTVFPAQFRSAMTLATAPAEKLSVRFEPAELQFKRGEKPKLKVIATRGEGLDEQITLATNPAKSAFPGNVNMAMKPIAKGQNEIELEFDTNDKAAPGAYSIVLTATHKKGNETTTVSTPALTYRITE